MIFEQRLESSKRMSQTDIWQKEVRAKGTASFCLGTGTRSLLRHGEEANVAGARRGREGGLETKLGREAKVRSYKVLAAMVRRVSFTFREMGVLEGLEPGNDRTNFIF